MVDYDKFDLEHAVETYKSMVTISTMVFKYLFLLNGGAGVAMITALEKLPDTLTVSVARWSIVCFVFGLLTVGVATFLAYFTQASLHEENMNRQAHGSYKCFWIMAIICCAVSLAMFCVGALIAVFSMY